MPTVAAFHPVRDCSVIGIGTHAVAEYPVCGAARYRLADELRSFEIHIGYPQRYDICIAEGRKVVVFDASAAPAVDDVVEIISHGRFMMNKFYDRCKCMKNALHLLSVWH